MVNRLEQRRTAKNCWMSSSGSPDSNALLNFDQHKPKHQQSGARRAYKACLHCVRSSIVSHPLFTLIFCQFFSLFASARGRQSVTSATLMRLDSRPVLVVEGSGVSASSHHLTEVGVSSRRTTSKHPPRPPTQPLSILLKRSRRQARSPLSISASNQRVARPV